ncbi:MAG: hypothetical protein KAY37_03890 [Phycisphaerae bacterium]|nr:hypothetical protein [Phycisphaerae bacterium]
MLNFAEYAEIAKKHCSRAVAHPDVDDTERAALDITVPDTEPTPTGPPVLTGETPVPQGSS